jgi:hypothetical protein
MSLTGETFVGTEHPDCHDPSAFGLAVAQLLKARHPYATAKLVALDLSRQGAACTTKTAENILAGKLSGKSITRLTLAYGLGFLIDAGARVTGKTLEAFIIEQADQARIEEQRWTALLGKPQHASATDPPPERRSGVRRRGELLLDASGAARDQGPPVG